MLVSLGILSPQPWEASPCYLGLYESFPHAHHRSFAGFSHHHHPLQLYSLPLPIKSRGTFGRGQYGELAAGWRWGEDRGQVFLLPGRPLWPPCPSTKGNSSFSDAFPPSSVLSWVRYWHPTLTPAGLGWYLCPGARDCPLFTTLCSPLYCKNLFF